MQHVNSSVFKCWTVVRSCVQQAATYRAARRIQSGHSRNHCHVPLREASASYTSPKGNPLHGQQQQSARAYTTEPPSPLSDNGSSKSRAIATPVDLKGVASKGNVLRVLDDSQHPVRSGNLPSYVWPVLLDLKLAGKPCLDD